MLGRCHLLPLSEFLSSIRTTKAGSSHSPELGIVYFTAWRRSL